jgi:F0F1-type ATP synthase membrane subunit b/b'
MKKTTLTIILTSILAFSVSFGQQRPRIAKIMVAKAIKEKVSSGDIVRLDRPELSDDAKDQLSELKGKKDALCAELKENISNLGEGASKEEIKEATQTFKQANQDRFNEIKEAHEALREKIKEARPHRQERPQIKISDELQTKVAVLKEKREELQKSGKALRENLKNSSTEEKKVIIAEYKETNKAKHRQIKENAQAFKEEIRENVETEATRTSDL